MLWSAEKSEDSMAGMQPALRLQEHHAVRVDKILALAVETSEGRRLKRCCALLMMKD